MFSFLLLLAMLCFTIDVLGLFSGLSMFSNTVNVLHIVCHFIGSLGINFMIIHTCPGDYYT